MQEFLKRIQVTPGWWNNYANGWTDDVTMNMTPIQLLKLMLSFEFRTLPILSDFKRNFPDALENLAHASTHSAHGLCEVMSSGPFCSTMSSPNAIFNYMGSLQVAIERSKGMIGSVLANNGNTSVANYIVGEIMSPTNPEWRNGGSGKSLVTMINGGSSHVLGK